MSELLTLEEKQALLRANHPTGVFSPYQFIDFDWVYFRCWTKWVQSKCYYLTIDEYFQWLWFNNESHYLACKELLSNKNDESSLKLDKMVEFATD